MPEDSNLLPVSDPIYAQEHAQWNSFQQQAGKSDAKG